MKCRANNRISRLIFTFFIFLQFLFLFCVEVSPADIFSNVHKRKRLSALKCISLRIHLKEISFQIQLEEIVHRLSWRNISTFFLSWIGRLWKKNRNEILFFLVINVMKLYIGEENWWEHVINQEINTSAVQHLQFLGGLMLTKCRLFWWWCRGRW